MYNDFFKRSVINHKVNQSLLTMSEIIMVVIGRRKRKKRTMEELTTLRVIIVASDENKIYYFTYFSTVVPSNSCVFLSYRPFVVNTFSTGLMGKARRYCHIVRINLLFYLFFYRHIF